MVELKFNDYTETKYIHIGEFHDGLAAIKNRQGLWGYIDKKGTEIIPCQFHCAKDFSEYSAAVANEQGLWGYINYQGKELIPCQFKEADDFSEGLAAVKTNLNYYVYINKIGNIIRGSYSEASSFNSGYAKVKHEGSNLCNFIDKDGLHYGRYLDATIFMNGMALIFNDEYIYIINTSFAKSSKKLSRESISKAFLCDNGYILIKNNYGKYGYLNTDLEEITPISFSNARSFNEGYAIIELSEDFIGFINESGKITAFSKQHQYYCIRDFYEGLAAVQNNEGLWGYINPQGKEVIPCQFKEADDFSEGLAGVIDNDNNYYYIDKKGKKIISIDKEYYSSIELSDQVITIKADSPQALAKEKLRILSIAKEDIINSTINMIDQLAYTESSELYQQQTRKRTNQKRKQQPPKQ